MKSRFILLGLLPAFCFRACSAVANSPYVAQNTIWSDESGDFWFQYEGPNYAAAFGSYAHGGNRYAVLAYIASPPKRAYLYFESNGSLQGFFNFHTDDAKADSFTLSAGWTNEGDAFPMDPSPLTGLKMASRALRSEEIDAKYYLRCMWTTSYFFFTSWGSELENKTLTPREPITRISTTIASGGSTGVRRFFASPSRPTKASRPTILPRGRTGRRSLRVPTSRRTSTRWS
jgi:hypothetical protein